MLGRRNRKSIWSAIKNSGMQINICDVGSAGERPYYFSECKESLIFTDFEANSNGELFGLGAEKSTSSLYSTKNSHMSSVYEPNVSYLSKRFHDCHWRDRQVDSMVKFKVTKLDEVFDKEQKLDFLKIDTQGSEYNILLGAKETILKHSPIIYCECWLDMVYKEAPLADKIMGLMYELGYKVAAMQIGADWDTNTASNAPGRKIPVGVDFVFVPGDLHTVCNHRSIVAKCVILECLGLFQLSLETAKCANSDMIKNCSYLSQQNERIKRLPNRKLVKALDFCARGPFKAMKLVPNLYD